MNDLTQKAKSRKFISFAFVMVVSTICLGIGAADFNDWAEIIKWDMGFYFSANLLGRFAGEDQTPLVIDPEIQKGLDEY